MINIGFDFDGVLHISVKRPLRNGQIINKPGLNFKQIKPNTTIIKLIKEYHKMNYKIFIISHRFGSNKYINNFLKRMNINEIIPPERVYTVKGNKFFHLKKNNIDLFFEDSTNVLQNIKKKDKKNEITLFRVDPRNEKKNPSINNIKLWKIGVRNKIDTKYDLSILPKFTIK